MSRETLLGTDLARGQHVQSVVQGGCWFGATPAIGVDCAPEGGFTPKADFALVGCTVAPGFDFADFEMGKQQDLIQAFPQAHTLIQEFTSE